MFDSFESISTRNFTALDGEGFAPIYLWPYDINYDVSSIDVSGGKEVDIPAFFGLGVALDDAQRRNNERIIAGLLNSVIIHIVFLDKSNAINGCPEFKSIKEVTLWADKLKKGLDIRFRNEHSIHDIENVLVVVTGAEQITATKEELEEFNECIGSGLLFDSCYLLGYNLSIGQSYSISFSEDVWDIVVKRLLMAFALSNSHESWWKNPGIKVWQSFDCGTEINQNSEQEFMNAALTNASKTLRRMLSQSDQSDMPFFKSFFEDENDSSPSEIGDLQPSDDKIRTRSKVSGLSNTSETKGKNEGRLLRKLKLMFAKWRTNLFLYDSDVEWRKEPTGGWSEYDADRCVSMTKDSAGTRWGNGFNVIRQKFAEWRTKNTSNVFKNPTEDGSEESDTEEKTKSMFGFIHSSPGSLFGFIDALFEKLSNQFSVDRSQQSSKWTALAEAETERKLAISRLEENSVEFSKAQSRYVGWGVGLLVFASVSVMFGWVSYRLSAALLPLIGVSGPAIFLIACFLFTCISLGSLFAVIIMVGCHHFAGKRAMIALIEDSRLADDEMSLRDKKAREIVRDGIESCRAIRLHGFYFRMWAILKRLETMLYTEMKPASLSSDLSINNESVDIGASSNDGSFRKKFLDETHEILDQLDVNKNDANLLEKINEIVIKWWVMNDEETADKSPETFMQLWRQFAKLDAESAGYYPAKVIVPKLRLFVSQFLEDVRLEIKKLVFANHAGDLKPKIIKWVDDINKKGTYSYASSAINAHHVNENRQTDLTVYLSNNASWSFFNNDGTLLDDQLTSIRDDANGLCILNHPLINKTPYIGLAYREFLVELDTDKNNNLIFKEVSDKVERDGE